MVQLDVQEVAVLGDTACGRNDVPGMSWHGMRCFNPCNEKHLTHTYSDLAHTIKLLHKSYKSHVRCLVIVVTAPMIGSYLYFGASGKGLNRETWSTTKIPSNRDSAALG